MPHFTPSLELAADIEGSKKTLALFQEADPACAVPYLDTQGYRLHIEQLRSYIETLEGEFAIAEDIECEANRRGISPQELWAQQNDPSDPSDYDDHSSDDPRCEQNILCELGMSLLISPVRDAMN